MPITNPPQPSADCLALLYRRPLTSCDAKFSMRQSVMALLRLRAILWACRSSNSCSSRAWPNRRGLPQRHRERISALRASVGSGKAVGDVVFEGGHLILPQWQRRNGGKPLSPD
jgi:hypothetical protein